MKRIVLIITATSLVVMIGFGIFLLMPLSTPVREQSEASPDTSTPPPEEVIAVRFPDLDESFVRKAQEDSLRELAWSFHPPLTELQEPNVRREIWRKREKFITENLAGDLKANADEAVRKSVHQWLKRVIEPNEYFPWELRSQAKNAFVPHSDAKTVDPLIRLIGGDYFLKLSDQESAGEQLAGLSKELAATDRPFLLQILAGQLELQVPGQPHEQQEKQERLIGAVINFLKQHSDNHEGLGFAWEFSRDTFHQLSLAGCSQLVARSVQEDGINDFMVHMLISEFYRRKAWDERGGGYANTVGHSGWHFFEEYMEIASLHYRIAWALRPDLPYAADRMIMVAKAHGDEWTPRDWFDLTVGAQFDFTAAYNSYLHTLKPRWGGSISEMLEFGYECAATKDYPSEVGDFLYQVIDQITEESEMTSEFSELNPKAFYRLFENQRLQQKLRQHWKDFDEAVRNDRDMRQTWILFRYSRRAACAMAFGEWEILSKALKSLSDEPNFDNWLPFYSDGQRARLLAEALTSEDPDQILKIDKRFGPGFRGDADLQELEALHQQLAQLVPGLSDKGKPWANTIRFKTQTLQDYLSDEWVRLPFGDLSGWKIKGNATINDDGSVTIRNLDGTGLNTSPRIDPLTPFPPPYKVIATVEPIGEPGGEPPQIQSVGIDLGTTAKPVQTGGCFVSAMTRPPGGGVVSRHPKFEQSFEIAGADLVTTIRVNAWNDFYEAQYDDSVLPIPVHPDFRASPFLSFGGGRNLKDPGTVRIADVRIRRIPARPDPKTATADEVAAFHETMRKIDPDDRVQLLKLADARVLQNRFLDARELLDSIREADGDSFVTWPTVAAVLIGSGRFAEARQHLENMVRINPHDQRLPRQFAWILATAPDDELRNGQQALTIIQPLVSANPQDWQLMLTLSAALAETGDTESAAEYFRKSESLASSNVVAMSSIERIKSWRDEEGRIRLKPIPDESQQTGSSGSEDASVPSGN